MMAMFGKLLKCLRKLIYLQYFMFNEWHEWLLSMYKFTSLHHLSVTTTTDTTPMSGLSTPRFGKYSACLTTILHLGLTVMPACRSNPHVQLSLNNMAELVRYDMVQSASLTTIRFLEVTVTIACRPS